MRIPYAPGHAIRIGGWTDPKVVELTLNGRIRPRVQRLISWPGFVILIARYEPRKVK